MARVLFTWMLAMPALLGAPTAAVAATQGATARTVALRPLSVVKVRDLDFGGIIPGATAGTVVIAAATDARSATGGVTLAGGGSAAAQFLTYGGPLQFVVISAVALPVLTRAGGGTMNVTALTLNGSAFRFLNATGLLDLRVGGTLAVAANQPDGLYTGSFVITVDYF